MEHRAYQDLYDHEDSYWWFVGRRAIIRHMIASRVPEKVDSALDIGCGTGRNMHMLGEFAQRVEGWDTSPTALSFAQKKYPDFAVSRVRFPDVPEGAGTYSLVTLLDVLEHIDDDARALRALDSLLAPRGIAIITVPAFSFLFSEHDLLLHHFRRYTKAHLRDLIRNNTSLTITALAYFNTLLFPPIALLRLAKKITGIRTHESDFFPLPPIANKILSSLFSLEQKGIGRVPVPFGVSLIAVLTKSP